MILGESIDGRGSVVGGQSALIRQGNDADSLADDRVMILNSSQADMKLEHDLVLEDF